MVRLPKPRDGGSNDTGRPLVDACTCGPTETCDGDVCVMATGLANPTTIAVSGSFVVFTEQGTPRARACPLTGCTSNGPTLVQPVASSPRLHRPGLGGGTVVLFDKGVSGNAWEIQGITATSVGAVSTPQAVAASPSLVVVENNSSLYVCERPGFSLCGSQLSQKATNELASSAFAIVGSRVVWAENEAVYTCNASSFNECEQKKGLLPLSGQVTHMVADSDAVLVVSDGSLRLAPVSATAAARDLGSVGTPSAVTADSTRVFVAGSGVRVIDKSTGSSVTKYAGRSPKDIAESGASLYWIEGDKLIRAAK
jgi:hypothetical protein